MIEIRYKKKFLTRIIRELYKTNQNVFDFSEAIVETAVVNTPAIKLYNKHGFIEFKTWTPSHGIQKLAMSVEHAL